MFDNIGSVLSLGAGNKKLHQSQLFPTDNKFHKGAPDGKHYWLTPPDIYGKLDAEFNFTFDPCPYPLSEGFDGLTCEWGESSYVNPPFGSILHTDPATGKVKKKGPTAWARKAIEENKKGKTVVMVYPIDKWVLMLLAAGAQVRNLGDIRWLATEDRSQGKGTGRHIACFVLENTRKNEDLIYLQHKDDPEYNEDTGQLWCQDNVFEKSVKYIKCNNQ